MIQRPLRSCAVSKAAACAVLSMTLEEAKEREETFVWHDLFIPKG